MILAIGVDQDSEGLRDTPTRVAQMYEEFFSGLNQDPSEVLATGFEEPYDGIVLLRDIPFFSICEHHLVPFFGTAHIGYVPGSHVVGASKLASALDILAHRPQIQERLTRQLVNVIFDTIHPQAVIAVLSAEHLCVSLRGVKKPGSKIVTSTSRGTFETDTSTKQECLALLLGPRS